MPDPPPHTTLERRANRTLQDSNELVLLLSLLVITIAISLYAAGPGELPGDVWVIQQVQSVDSDALATISDWLDRFGTARGTLVPALIIAAWLAWRRWWGYAILLVTAPVVSGIVNTTLKVLLDSPRPTDEVARISGSASGMGFPSGHAMHAMLFFGVVWVIASRLIQQIRLRRLAEGFAALMVVLAGLARIYIGVHWPSDVLGGYLWGFLLLALMIIVYDYASARLTWLEPGKPPRGQA